MSKHLADHREASDGGRAKNFINLEKQRGAEGSHPATRKVATRPVVRSDARRIQEFLRIERGDTA
tara:strand:- start:3212 stop:3406 length:195 start_codon:yes stop_codon:yes gene_type:complete